MQRHRHVTLRTVGSKCTNAVHLSKSSRAVKRTHTISQASAEHQTSIRYCRAKCVARDSERDLLVEEPCHLPAAKLLKVISKANHGAAIWVV